MIADVIADVYRRLVLLMSSLLCLTKSRYLLGVLPMLLWYCGYETSVKSCKKFSSSQHDLT